MTNPILTIVMPAFNEEVALKKYLPEVIEFCEEKNIKEYGNYDSWVSVDLIVKKQKLQ